MPLLVCGAEGEQMLYDNTLDTSQGNTAQRRGSVRVNVGQQMFKSWTGTNDIWVHVRSGGPNSGSNTGSGQVWMAIRNSTGGTMLDFLEGSQTFTANRFFQIRRRQTNAGSLVTNSENFTTAPFELINIDVRIQRTTTTNANDTITYSVYINEVLRFQETNTDAGGWTVPAQLLLQGRHTNGNHDQMYYQDVIVSDAVPTVGMELAVLVPSAVGNYDQFVNNYTNIDDLGYDPATVISSSATGQRESWIFATPTFNLGNKVIYAVVLDTVAQLDIAGTITDFQPFLRIAGTDYAGANLGANNVAPDSYVTEFLTNPATSQPWTQADLTGLEAGLLTV